MLVYALVGPSGTGKSHNSKRVAEKFNIDYLIDDGLLIYKNKILAGKSAKKEKTKIASVKRALFMDSTHSENLKIEIKKCKIKSILILGTSIGMIKKIVETLDLPSVCRIIKIEQVSSSSSIQIAQKMRNSEGKHVIPAPTLEVKKHFFGYFLNGRNFLNKKTCFLNNRTVVRPDFSFRGEYTISNRAIKKICVYKISQNSSIHKIYNIEFIRNLEEKRMDLKAELGFKRTENFNEICNNISKALKKTLEKVVGISLGKICLTVKTVI